MKNKIRFVLSLAFLSLCLAGCAKESLIVKCSKATGEIRFEVGEEKTLTGYPVSWTNQNRRAKWGGRSAIVGYLGKADMVDYYNECAGRT